MNCQSKRETNYTYALSDLLQLSYGLMGSTSVRKFIDWVNKYACNKDFQMKVKQGRKFEVDEPDYLHMVFPEILSDKNTNFSKLLNKKKIEYIDKIFVNNKKESFSVSVKDVRKCIMQAQTITELYMFVKGYSMQITPVAHNQKPLLEPRLIRAFEGFLPLKELQSINNFLIEDSYCYELGITEAELENYEIFSGLDDAENEFNKAYRKHFDKPPHMDETDTLIISKNEPFGEAYYSLALEIICKYLEKCSSYANYINSKKCAYMFDTQTQKFRKMTPTENEIKEPKELTGFYRLHATLAECLLNERVLTCTNCNRPFVAKRKDAKTCCAKCRNELSIKKRIKQQDNSKGVILTRQQRTEA